MSTLRNLLSIFLLLMWTACSVDEAVYEAEVEQDITRQLEAQKIAWNEGDIDRFLEPYLKGTDLRFLSATGMVKGSDKLLDRYLEAYPSSEQMGKLDFDIKEFDLLCKDHASIIGKWILTRGDERREGYFTLLWKRTDEGWRIIIDHTS